MTLEYIFKILGDYSLPRYSIYKILITTFFFSINNYTHRSYVKQSKSILHIRLNI